jgi:hypothetical protein
LSSRSINSPVTWRNLNGMFRNRELSRLFEHLEIRYAVKNEANLFAKLVNMSTASREPFHRWIRYREGYAGELVKEILRRYPIDADRFYLMDPMCGSGSSLVAAKQQGIASVGLDVNGYAVLAANVKVYPYTKEDLANIRRAINRFNSTVLDEVNPKSTLLQISKYFPRKNFSCLCSIENWNSKIKTLCVRDFFKLALLAILEECSDRKKDGNGLATRPAPVNDPISRMREQLELMFLDIATSVEIRAAFSAANDCSALKLSDVDKIVSKRSNKRLGVIIFSPPYANSFDYFESYKLELVFGGFTTVDNMKTARERLIRNYRITKPRPIEKRISVVEMISSEIMLRIPEKERETGVRDGRTRLVPNMLRGYFEDMSIVLEEGYKCLGRGGMLHIVIDQSAYVGVPIPTDLILAALSEEAGFQVEELISCRKANTSGQQARKFPYLKDLLRESIVSLRKPD